MKINPYKLCALIINNFLCQPGSESPGSASSSNSLRRSTGRLSGRRSQQHLEDALALDCNEGAVVTAINSLDSPKKASCSSLTLLAQESSR